VCKLGVQSTCIRSDFIGKRTSQRIETLRCSAKNPKKLTKKAGKHPGFLLTLKNVD
jgi:hypothetical protein